VELEAVKIFPLAKNEKWFVPMATVSVFEGSNMTFCLGIKITSLSGVVYTVKNKDNQAIVYLGNIQYKILYSPEGHCVLCYSEKAGKVTTKISMQSKAMENNIPTGSNPKDWGHFKTAQEKNIKASTENDGDSVYGVCQWVLPFRVLKNVTNADYFLLFERKTSGHSLSLLLWHADQSGHTAVKIKSSVFAVNSDDETKDDE